MDQDYKSLLLLPVVLFGFWLKTSFDGLSFFVKTLCWLMTCACLISFGIWYWARFSGAGRKRQKQIEDLNALPPELLIKNDSCVFLGHETDLNARIFLPDSIRTRHTHILGATGSGKTESVILNFLRQDIARGLGAIILDAKGDASFIDDLRRLVPADRLFVFDLSSEESMGYDPLSLGSPLESSQRLFSSLVWSEEYYKSKALNALQRLFQAHFEINKKNPTLLELNGYLDSAGKYAAFLQRKEKDVVQEFNELAGLSDQVRSLTVAHLAKTLSPGEDGISLKTAEAGNVIYFRLQSLMSPQLSGTVGRLIINNLNFLAGTAHRGKVEANAKERRLIPVYLDEFATFACAEFADLISKARSAGFALHFSHQSIGDLKEVSEGFLSRITDNSGTKIVMRINDPESAEYFAWCFGTREIQKTTQRITNAKKIDDAEVVGEGTTRDAHQFRASPDLLKTLPTGWGAVLIAHGKEGPIGGSHVFKIRFPHGELVAV